MQLFNPPNKRAMGQPRGLAQIPESGLPLKHVKVKAEAHTWEQFMLQGTTGDHQVHIPLKAGL